MLYLSAGKAKMLKQHADELAFMHAHNSFGESEYIKKVYNDCNSILLYCYKNHLFYSKRHPWYIHVRTIKDIDVRKLLMNIYEIRYPKEFYNLPDYQRFKKVIKAS